MSDIHSFFIDNDGEHLIVELIGYAVEKATFWEIKDYPNPSKGIDLSSHVGGNIYPGFAAQLPASVVGLEFFSGGYILEVIFKDPTEVELVSKRAFAINLVRFYECLLEKILSVKTEGCVRLIDECENCPEDVFYLSTVLNSFPYAVHRGANYEEGIRLLEIVEDICDPCGGCQDVNVINKVVPGYHYGFVNGEFSLISEQIKK